MMPRARSHNVVSFLTIVTLYVLLTTHGARSQSLEEYGTRPSGLGARAAALADAYTADAFDVGSMYWNPGSLSFLRKTSILVNHRHEWTNSAFNEIVATPIIMARNQVFALGVQVTHLGHITSPSNFQFIQYGLDMGYSINILPTLSVGMLMGIRFGKTETSSLSAVTTTVGIFYYPTPALSYGAVFSGIGSGIKYSYDGVKSYLELDKRLPRSLELGGSMRFPSTANLPIVTLSLSSEKFYLTDEIRYKGGLEGYVLSFLAVRIGYVRGLTGQGARYGLGILTDRFQVNVAVKPGDSADRFDELSISIFLGGR